MYKLHYRIELNHVKLFYKTERFLQNASSALSNKCYYYDLNSNTPTNIWNGSLKMNTARQNPLLVPMGDKV